MNPPTLGVVGCVVSDMARTLSFYRDLGLAVPDDTGGHVEVVLPSGLRLAWDTREVIASFDPRWRPPQGSHRVALCFEYADPDEVDEAYAVMTGRGHHGHLAPWDAAWGQRYAVLHDPDGNAVDLFAALDPG